MALALGVGAAVPDEFIAARFQGIDDTRRIIENGGVDQVSCRQVQFIEQVEAAPDANPVAVISPGKSSGIRCRACHGQEVTFTRAECEVFDVETEIDRQPLPVRPAIVRTVDDWRIGVAIMIRKLHIRTPAFCGLAAGATGVIE
jgi:hypothetical protein